MAAPFSVTCPSCDASLKLKSQAAVGKKIACPKCQKPFVVPEPEEGVDGDDEDEFAEAPRKSTAKAGAGRSSGAKPSAKGKSKSKGKSGKKSGGGMSKGVLIGGGVLASLLLLGGIGFVIYGYVTAEDPQIAGASTWAAWAPADTQVLVEVKASELADNAVIQPLLSDPKMSSGIQELTANSGLQLKDIERITMAFMPAAVAQKGQPPQDKDQMVAIVRTKADLTQEQRQNAGAKGAKLRHSNRTYYQISSTSTSSQLASYVPNSRTIIQAPESLLKTVIEGGGADPALAKFGKPKSTSQLTVAFADGSFSTLAPPGQEAKLQGIKGGQVDVSFKSGLTVDVTAKCDNDAKATEMLDEAKKMKSQAEAMITLMAVANGLNPSPASSMSAGDMHKLLQGVTIAAQGADLSLGLVIPEDMLQKGVVQAQAYAKQFAPPPVAASPSMASGPGGMQASMQMNMANGAGGAGAAGGHAAMGGPPLGATPPAGGNSTDPAAMAAAMAANNPAGAGATPPLGGAAMAHGDPTAMAAGAAGAAGAGPMNPGQMDAMKAAMEKQAAAGAQAGGAEMAAQMQAQMQKNGGGAAAAGANQPGMQQPDAPAEKKKESSKSKKKKKKDLE